MKFFTILLVTCALASTAYAQDAENPYDSGVRIPITQEVQRPTLGHETIIVTGRRPASDMPPAYAQYVYQDPATLTHDASAGEDRYIYIRPMLSMSEQTTMEFYSTWTGNSSDNYNGAPTHNGRSGRLVCRPDNVLRIFVDPFGLLAECAE